jgi:hypothetical protein
MHTSCCLKKLLGVPRDIASTVYFHLPSFSGRCDLLNKLIKRNWTRTEKTNGMKSRSASRRRLKKETKWRITG